MLKRLAQRSINKWFRRTVRGISERCACDACMACMTGIGGHLLSLQSLQAIFAEASPLRFSEEYVY